MITDVSSVACVHACVHACARVSHVWVVPVRVYVYVRDTRFTSHVLFIFRILQFTSATIPITSIIPV